MKNLADCSSGLVCFYVLFSIYYPSLSEITRTQHKGWFKFFYTMNRFTINAMERQYLGVLQKNKKGNKVTCMAGRLQDAEICAVWAWVNRSRRDEL